MNKQHRQIPDSCQDGWAKEQGQAQQEQRWDDGGGLTEAKTSDRKGRDQG